MSFLLVEKPKLNLTEFFAVSEGTFIALKTGLSSFFELHALPVEMQNPSESNALSITCPGMFSNEACIIHGE